ncbi:MAG: precorrin-8X methylmutase [Dongiaceae bacterium]
MAETSDLILSLSKDARLRSKSPESGAAEHETPGSHRYLRDPDAIYRESFAIIRREARLDRLPPDIAEVAVRLIHSCGMTDIVDDLAFTADLVPRARAALAANAPVLCDSAMTAAGVIRARLPGANEVICTLADPRVPALAAALRTTRSAAAIELWMPRLAGAVVAIGNAPTALVHLLERLAGGSPAPAAILAFPVGFVGAVESKQALIDARPAPYLTLKGRRGGSALAAAAVNALLAGDAA